ncbi:hypothetical protein [Leptothrix cholodnii]|nr:hypothetical protein [Leptothrix cholodnii]
MTFLRQVATPIEIITAIDASIRFPEILDACKEKYAKDIELFKTLVRGANSSASLLASIRTNTFSGEQRMSLLKMYRRCVSPVIDTEMAKKITKVTTESLVSSLGHTFKPIAKLKAQFETITADQEAALAALIGEYDTRGQLGYLLTGQFFDWFEQHFAQVYTIEGPRGAGRDIELSTVFPDFRGDYPCDFVIRNARREVKAVGFARYDSTRGGAQSDDRTGGNSDKVSKAQEYCKRSGKSFRLVFLADGPGLGHVDTWKEAVKLDDAWDGNIRVITLKTAVAQLTSNWLG